MTEAQIEIAARKLCELQGYTDNWHGWPLLVAEARMLIKKVYSERFQTAIAYALAQSDPEPQDKLRELVRAEGLRRKVVPAWAIDPRGAKTTPHSDD
jgi:hypothetical protein